MLTTLIIYWNNKVGRCLMIHRHTPLVLQVTFSLGLRNHWGPKHLLHQGSSNSQRLVSIWTPKLPEPLSTHWLKFCLSENWKIKPLFWLGGLICWKFCGSLELKKTFWDLLWTAGQFMDILTMSNMMERMLTQKACGREKRKIFSMITWTDLLYYVSPDFRDILVYPKKIYGQVTSHNQKPRIRNSLSLSLPLSFYWKKLNSNETIISPWRGLLLTHGGADSI